jgi:hypothetical protein
MDLAAYSLLALAKKIWRASVNRAKLRFNTSISYGESLFAAAIVRVIRVGLQQFAR